MRVLTVNAGSSSLKLRLLDADDSSIAGAGITRACSLCDADRSAAPATSTTAPSAIAIGTIRRKGAAMPK